MAGSRTPIEKWSFIRTVSKQTYQRMIGDIHNHEKRTEMGIWMPGDAAVNGEGIQSSLTQPVATGSQVAMVGATVCQTEDGNARPSYEGGPTSIGGARPIEPTDGANRIRGDERIEQADDTQSEERWPGTPKFRYDQLKEATRMHTRKWVKRNLRPCLKREEKAHRTKGAVRPTQGYRITNSSPGGNFDHEMVTGCKWCVHVNPFEQFTVQPGEDDPPCHRIKYRLIRDLETKQLIGKVEAIDVYDKHARELPAVPSDLRKAIRDAMIYGQGVETVWVYQVSGQGPRIMTQEEAVEWERTKKTYTVLGSMPSDARYNGPKGNPILPTGK